MNDSSPGYLEALRSRVLVFDGAYGTQIQAQELTAAEWGGPALEGANDWLVLHRPDIIEGIHRGYLAAGCDVLETTTFQATRPRLTEWGVGEHTRELNVAAAAIARRVADEFRADDGRPRFVAGALGPTGFLPSSDDPALSAVTFAQLVEWYREQADALIEGGADLLLYETAFDLLELKAALQGMQLAARARGRQVPLQAQVTLDQSGRMLLGTDIAAASATLEYLPGVEVIGINCSTGPEPMREPLRYLVENCSRLTVCIPNAGIPRNVDGRAQFDLEPEPFAEALAAFALELGVNAVGGCCGTTPAHIRQLVDRLGARPAPGVRPRPVRLARVASPMTAVSLPQEPAPHLVGERVNAQGSRRVKELLLADDYDGLLQVARQQSESGAHTLDVCVALTERADEAVQMREVVRRLAASVEQPLVIDSTEADVIQAALESYGGRAIVNSVNLENGRVRCDAVLPLVRDHGAAVMALTIDPAGMARTRERKLEVARAIYEIAVGEYGLSPDTLIYDALTFTLATGDVEFRDSAVETIEGIRLIKRELPGTLTSLGVSNVSFGLSPSARGPLNSVFLWHCVQAGLDLAIVNPAHIVPIAEIDPDVRLLAEDLVLNRHESALERYIAHFEAAGAETAPGSAAARASAEDELLASLTPAERVHWQILNRRRDGIEEQVDLDLRRRLGLRRDQRLPRAGERLSVPMAQHEASGRPGPSGSAATVHEAAVATLNEVLLPAMKEVGDRFGAGELILPFVLQSAEVMKRAVAHLENYLERLEGTTKGTVVLATVYGDVHDIGKNLVHTILENNGYTVHDLGKQVPLNTIIDKAIEVKADAIGLSALLVSTSKQMPLCVQELDRRGLEFPVVIGGAAINRNFGRRTLFVEEGRPYGPGVFYCRDAFEGLDTVSALIDPEERSALRELVLREAHEQLDREARRQPRVLPGAGSTPAGVARAAFIPSPPFLGGRVVTDIPLAEVFEHMDLKTLFKLSWGARGTQGEAFEELLESDFRPRLERMKAEALESGWLCPVAAYGYFGCNALGDELILWDPAAPDRELTRLAFARQPAFDRLCLADYFLPVDSGRSDTCALQVVTVGPEATGRVDQLQAAGDYSESYFSHGLGVAAAEGVAEWMHLRIRRELGLPPGQGKRYSWGYPACPELEEQEKVLAVLPAAEAGISLSPGFQLLPEQSTAAVVVHHPAAIYFAVQLGAAAAE
ncbi:MAG: methionine synthase [Candidatus Dormibacteria bacterium]